MRPRDENLESASQRISRDPGFVRFGVWPLALPLVLLSKCTSGCVLFSGAAANGAGGCEPFAPFPLEATAEVASGWSSRIEPTASLTQNGPSCAVNLIWLPPNCDGVNSPSIDCRRNSTGMLVVN